MCLINSASLALGVSSNFSVSKQPIRFREQMHWTGINLFNFSSTFQLWRQEPGSEPSLSSSCLLPRQSVSSRAPSASFLNIWRCCQPPACTSLVLHRMALPCCSTAPADWPASRPPSWCQSGSEATWEERRRPRTEPQEVVTLRSRLADRHRWKKTWAKLFFSPPWKTAYVNNHL